MRLPARFALAVLGVLVALGTPACGGGGGQADAGCPVPQVAPAAEPASTLDLAAALPCAEARAGKVGADQVAALPAGRQARSRAGDYKLYNCKVAFAIDGERVGDDYMTGAGLVTDADLAAPFADPFQGELRRNTGRDALRELAPLAEVTMPQVVRVALVNDGRDGQAAAVRAEGPAGAFALFTYFLPGLQPLPLWFVIDYRLAPGAEALEMQVTVTNLAAAPTAVPAGVAFQASRLMSGWAAGRGFIGSQQGRSEMLAAVGDRVSYGAFSPDGLEVQLDQYAISVAYVPGAVPEVPACATHTWTVYLAVAADGVEGLQRARRAVLGPAAGGLVAGAVTAAGGAPAVGAQVHALRLPDESPASMTVTDAAGRYQLTLPAGDYHLFATPPPAPLAHGYRLAAAGPVAVTVGDGAAAADLALPAAGTLVVDVTDGALPVPAKIQVEALAALPPRDARLGEPELPRGLAAYAFTAGGPTTLQLVPGDYRVRVSRGFFADALSRDVTVTAGAATPVAVALPEVVDRAGWLAMDTHIHADLSMDGTTTVEARLMSVVGEGIDLAVQTEHDVMSDYTPVIYAVGLEGLVAGFGGVEISPAPLGHFNAYPVVPDPAASNFGAPRWWEGFQPAAEIAALRAQQPGVVIQVNHPRSSGLGFFTYCDFDPRTGLPGKSQELWTLDFDAIEIANGGEDPEEVAQDYFGLLNLGVRVAPVGTSDAHGILESAVGCSRSYLRTDESFAALTPAGLAAGVHALRTQATRGLLVDARVGDASLGDVTTAAAATAAGLHVRIQGPPFANLTEVHVVENGVVLASRAVTPADQIAGTAILFEGDFPLQPARDSWYVVYARGDVDLAPVCVGQRPFAVTGPIYVDHDGDGQITAPGPVGG